MNKERMAHLCHITVTAFGVALLGYLFFRYLFVPLLPFIIAFFAAYLLNKPSLALGAKLHIPKKVISVVLTILAVVVGLGIIVSVTIWGLNSAWRFLSGLKDNEGFFGLLEKLTDPLGSILGGGESAALNEHIGNAVSNALSAVVAKLFSLLSGLVGAIPGVLFFILVTVIAAIYFSLDLERVKGFIRDLLPKGALRRLTQIKQGGGAVCKNYIRSYLIIMLITFVIMLVGFLLMGVRRAFPLALLVAVLDLLPLIGVGTVLVPWSIYQMLFGNLLVGIGLAVLLVVNEVVRQFLEPKIIGKSLGLHPIISLLLLYLGYSLFGFAGLILTPAVGILLNIFLNKKDLSKVD